MAFKEFDVVRVVATVPSSRVNPISQAACVPEPGDTGTVVMVYGTVVGEERAYAVERVESSGHTSWLADMYESELELVQAGGEGAA